MDNERDVTDNKSRFSTAMGFCLLVFLWGLFPITTKLVVQDISPLFYTSLRLIVAFCIMAVYIIYKHHDRVKLTYRHHWYMLMIGIFISGIPSASFAFAALYAPASVISIVWSTMPLFAALFSLHNMKKLSKWRLLISLIAGSFGVFIVLTGAIPLLPSISDASSLAFVKNSSAVVGEVAILVSAAMSAYALNVVRKRLSEITISVVTTWQLLYSSIFISIISFLFERHPIINITASSVLNFSYAIVCSCGCNVLTFWLVRRLGTIRTAYSDFLVPAATLILAQLLLGESITWAKAGGLVLVVAGALLLMRAV